MNNIATYNLFISHAWKYSEDYYKIIEWLDEEKDNNNNFNYKNYSVPEHDPIIDPNTSIGKNKLKELLKGQIKPVSKVIIVSGMYVAYSDWIDFEIDTAVDLGKYIIGIKPWGQEKVPTKVQNNSDIMVGWNKKSLIDAIINN